MVATRSHPEDFLPHAVSQTNMGQTRAIAGPERWAHTPTTLTLLWLLVSVPLVAWDTGYVLLRPHSMPNGKYHSPIWTPYALYGEVDYIYGWPAYNSNNGFTAAQASLNVVESVGYLIYTWVVWTKGRGGSKTVEGGWGGVACLAGFALSVMTVSKTILYSMHWPLSHLVEVCTKSLRSLFSHERALLWVAKCRT